MLGCTCACRHDGHGFNHSEEAGGCREGGEQGGREKKTGGFPPLESFCSSRTTKVKNHRHSWTGKNRQNAHTVTVCISKKKQVNLKFL